MAIIKWTPFVGPSWLDDFNQVWEDGTGPAGFTPAIDVYQDNDNVVVEAPLAGVDPAKVEIAIQNEVLTIKGESEKKSEVEDKNYYRKEVRCGSFYRAVQLPAQVAGDRAEAVYDQGVLTIKIPKIEETKPKNIKIKVK